MANILREAHVMENALSRADSNRAEYKRLRAKDLIWALGAALFAVALVFTAVFTSVHITDGGMSPTFSRGDVVLFNRLSKYFVSPSRGDVVLFMRDGQAELGRIVALPGESVDISGGAVYINGALLDEGKYTSGGAFELSRYITPEGCYFVLPDDRARADVFDAAALSLDAKEIAGVAFMRVSPLSSIVIFG